MGVLAGWRFCPRCAVGLRVEADHLGCPSCGSQYWANSMPGVQGILERDGRVMLAQRAREPRLGHWDLPGGFLHEDELPEDGLRREFREETGLEIRPVRLLRIDLEPYGDRFVFSVSWVVHDLDPSREPKAADDVAGLGWFAPDELPAEMAFPGQVGVLREWAGSKSPEPSR